MKIKQFCREKVRKLAFGFIFLPFSGSGPIPASTQWISFSGYVYCETNLWIILQSFVVQFYVGDKLDSSVEIDNYGTFKKEKFQTTVGPYVFKLTQKSTGQIVDQVKFEPNKDQKTYTVTLNACRNLKKSN